MSEKLTWLMSACRAARLRAKARPAVPALSARERFRRREGAKVVRTLRVGSLVFVLKGIGVMVVFSLGWG